MNGNSRQKDSISLYFHVPFCKHKCDYCHFFVIPDKRPFKLDYMEGLELEWNLWLPELADKQVCTVYFGGGTPSLLGPEYIARILSWVRSLNWENEHIETSLEANPEDIDTVLMKEYADAGINRVSIGIQSLDDQLLQILSRKHHAQKAKDAVYKVYESGIDNISIDLMYDLPQQTMQQWERTLKEALVLPIQHLSLYNLVFEQHTVFYKKQALLNPLLPDEETSANMYLEAVNQCRDSGLTQYEISAFQKPGHASKHNLGYWQGRPFLGLGPSAFSYWKGKRFRNIPHLGKYLKSLKSGASPIDYEEQLQGKDKFRELLAINLRLLEGVDLNNFQLQQGKIDEETLLSLSDLVAQELLAVQNSHYTLTQKGILFYDTVASAII